MSPRRKTVSDGDVLIATLRAMAKFGPVKLTLAHVAHEAGISPSTIVQRFGSKRKLLLAVAMSGADFIDECFVALRAQHRSPIAAIISGATQMAEQTTNAEELAHHLAFLQIDVTDPDFRRPLLETSAKTHAGYRALLDEAVAIGELRPCDTDQLARAISAISGGSLLNWGIFQQGSAARWVQKDLETLLEPYLEKKVSDRVDSAPPRSTRK